MATRKSEQQSELQEETIVHEAPAAAEPETPANVCMCACHEHPDLYPTTPEEPCGTCYHFNSDGKLIGPRKGWRPTKRGK